MTDLFPEYVVAAQTWPPLQQIETALFQFSSSPHPIIWISRAKREFNPQILTGWKHFVGQNVVTTCEQLEIYIIL